VKQGVDEVERFGGKQEAMVTRAPELVDDHPEVGVRADLSTLLRPGEPLDREPTPRPLVLLRQRGGQIGVGLRRPDQLGYHRPVRIVGEQAHESV